MSDDEDDLFADSDGDTDDLIAQSKPVAKPKKLKKLGSAATKKKRKRDDIPDADNDSDEEPGLFDSDDDDKPPAKKSAGGGENKAMSIRERMEALQAKRRKERESERPPDRKERKKKAVDAVPSSAGDKKKDGYDSEDSYDSAEYVRTAEDNAFIDAEGDDEDALAELYADQHFDDERGEAEEEKPRKKKISGTGSSRGRSELAELRAEGDDDNPIMQALQKMQRKKKVQKKFTELVDEEAKPFLEKMKEAADEDEDSIAKKRPALKKLQMIGEVCDMLARRDMQRPLLENDLLLICKRWIQPLPNGTLGNITVRRRILQSLSTMNGENGITASDLKRSEFGKVVMSLYMHKNETQELKKILKGMIEAWSRPIFQRSDNMRDLERVHHSRGATGISQISRIQQMEEQAVAQQKRAPVIKGHRGGKDQDLNSLIKSGAKGKTESGINRVRVPYSKGFQYSVRPTNRTSGALDKRRAPTGNAQDTRGKLGKRIIEKARTKAKNQRSANISIEGRQAK